MSNKYLISADIEGITGVVSNEFASAAGKFYPLAQRYMMSDINAVVRGILQGDPEAWIVVRDAHGSAMNLDLEKLHPRAHLIQGWGNEMSMVTAVDASYKGVFLVGYHAGGQNDNAVLAHTYSRVVHQVKVNGKWINETGISALYAGHFNVPIAFVSGDDHAVAEAKKQLGKDVVDVAVKQSLARDAALSLSLAMAQDVLEKEACRATLLLLKNKFKPMVFTTPVAVEVSLYNIGYTVSVYAKIKALLGFDGAYTFDDASWTISYRAKNQMEAFLRLTLLAALIYAVK
jgi:D-amino peptidase